MSRSARAHAPANESLAAGWRRLRSHPLVSPALWRERYREVRGGNPVNARHEPHIAAAIAWLVAAQDGSPDPGFSRGYSLAWHAEFGAPGWQPSYPETTGYIIPTLYALARLRNEPALAARATWAAQWEVRVQMPSGAIQAGVVGAPPTPAAFNTGQVLFGWLAAAQETGCATFLHAAHRAGVYLVHSLGHDAKWRRNHSPLAHPSATLYNARTAWALAEAGRLLDDPSLTEAAACALWAVARAQYVNGWLPECCLNDPDHPLLHTIAYAVRGLLEGGRVLEDDRLMRHAERAAEPLAALVRADGWMPGRVTPTWGAAATWSCLTGEAQMANVWLRLYRITGERRWIEPIPAVLRFLKATQNRTSTHVGLRGGIRGSAPISGPYGRHEVLSWPTKFFLDALLRDEGYVRHPTPMPQAEYLA